MKVRFDKSNPENSRNVESKYEQIRNLSTLNTKPRKGSTKEMKGPLRFSIIKRFLTTVKTTDYTLHSHDIPDKSTIFSLIQPTGKFHLGNYLGAVRVWKDLCDTDLDESKLLFGVADLHAITIPKPNSSEFRQYRTEAIASILSIGIDPKKAIIFHQSQVHQHAELHWILSTIAPVGYLNRMTQWKSKSNLRQDASDAEALGNVKLGLFAYPVLQAADILLYHSTHVPVGDDQSQHLELTRFLAQQFNKLYKKSYFPLPTTILAPTKKILSLASPGKKMSKSDANQNSVIYLNDDPETISKKIKKAITDSISHEFKYDPENRPGVSNLINIVSGIQRRSIAEVEKDVSVFNNHKDFKAYVTEVLVEELKKPREMFEMYMKDPQYLEEVTKSGAERASEIAEKNMKEIKSIMGY